MNLRSLSWPRFLAASVMLAGTWLFLSMRGQAEHLLPREQLHLFPSRVGDWTGTEISLPPAIREVLGDGDFLVRIYRRSPQQPYVDFFVAYFPTQRTGRTIHSPQNCLPGAGWSPIERSRIQLTLTGLGTAIVNRYVIAKGLDRQLVLYWYQAHGRVVASEYWAKIYLVADALRMNRGDGALVRLITPLASDESIEAGQRRAVEFAQEIAPLLDRYIPR